MPLLHLQKECWKCRLTPQSIVLEKLIVAQLVKNFPAFCGTRRFVTVFTRTRHWSLSWATWIQSLPLQPVDIISVLILSSRLCHGLSSGLFPSDIATKILSTSKFLTCVLHASLSHHVISLGLSNYAARMGEVRHAYKIIVGRPQEGRIFWRPMHRW